MKALAAPAVLHVDISRPAHHEESGPFVHVNVKHEAARIGDSLTLVPWLLALAAHHRSTVHVSGQFSAAVQPLLTGLPIQFGQAGQGRTSTTVNYTGDVLASWNYAGPRGLHMCQGYFDLAGMPHPSLPISLPLRAAPAGVTPGVVISPFSASEGADSTQHVRIWFVDRWRTVIQELLSSGKANHVYIVGGPRDDPSPYLTAGVTSMTDRSLDQILWLIQAAPLFISIDTGLSHVAHFGGVNAHLLLYPEVNFPSLMTNPRATMIRAWPRDITVQSVLAAAEAILARRR